MDIFLLKLIVHTPLTYNLKLNFIKVCINFNDYPATSHRIKLQFYIDYSDYALSSFSKFF